MVSKPSSLHRWIYLGALMLAGESIYMVPSMRKTFPKDELPVGECDTRASSLLVSRYSRLREI